MVVMVSARVGHRQSIRLAIQPFRCQLSEPCVMGSPLSGFQLRGPLVKMGQLLWRTKIGLVGNQNIGCGNLIPELHVAENFRLFEPAGVHQANHRPHGENIPIVLTGQGFQNLGGMTEPGWLDQQPLRPGLVDQLV